MNAGRPDKRADIRRYAIGYLSALALTAAAFALVRWRTYSIRITLGLVFGLALAQAVVHFRYFLHIGLRRSSRDDLLLILFSVLIIILMVSGTIVIMGNLRDRMM